jgi:hypothetical protein
MCSRLVSRVQDRMTTNLSNKSFENVENFKYLVTTLANQNCVREEIKSKVCSRNAYCHSVQNIFSSSLLPGNVKIKIYRTVILCILYGCESWSAILREAYC